MKEFTQRKENVRTVTEITRELRGMLERTYSTVWIEGEIFTLRRPNSGHLYFQLKDPNAQLAAVMFRSAASRAGMVLKDGVRVQCLGRLTMYEPQGRCQLVVEAVRPAGDGALLAALEALKRKLHAEGFFSPELKKQLPFIPQTIGIVTSPTGAAIQDMIRSIHDRYPANLLVYPCRVQGQTAASEIARGIETLDAMADVSVIVIGRGGGSLEDLWAFNEEVVARAIHRSKTPIISAVGHEIDVLISDFTADVRAPTPTGVAPLVVPEERTLRLQLERQRTQLTSLLLRDLERRKNRIRHLRNALPHPRHSIETRAARLDECEMRLRHGCKTLMMRERARLQRAAEKLVALHPARGLRSSRKTLSQLQERLSLALDTRLKRDERRLAHIQARLRALGPQQVLERGYAIARDERTGKVIKHVQEVTKDQALHIMVANGQIRSRVLETSEDNR